MSYSLDLEQGALGARIKVVGVGGAGGNAVNTMIQSKLEGVDFIVANTDRQALDNNLAQSRLQIGAALTRGLGAGADPKVGEKAALESQADIATAVSDADMVFVTTGLGGGTGTGAAPIVAKAAREAGALTVAVVSKPFHFEGKKRMRKAEEGLDAIREAVDTIIVVPNERLVAMAGDQMSLIEAFRCADTILYNAVKGVSDLITQGGLVNVDFADVKSVMQSAGLALMGTGEASGERRAIEAAELAISSPLLEDAQINGASGVLVNVTAGPDLKMTEISAAVGLIEEVADDDANIIFGAVIDEEMGESIRVTVIATGFPEPASPRLRARDSGAVTDNFNAREHRGLQQSARRDEAVARAVPPPPSYGASAYGAPSYASPRSEMSGAHPTPREDFSAVASTAHANSGMSVRTGSDYES